MLSPLLANLYMRRFVLGWKKLGLERNLHSRIVTYTEIAFQPAKAPVDLVEAFGAAMYPTCSAAFHRRSPWLTFISCCQTSAGDL